MIGFLASRPNAQDGGPLQAGSTEIMRLAAQPDEAAPGRTVDLDCVAHGARDQRRKRRRFLGEGRGDGHHGGEVSLQQPAALVGDPFAPTLAAAARQGGERAIAVGDQRGDPSLQPDRPRAGHEVLFHHHVPLSAPEINKALTALRQSNVPESKSGP
ncbi:hypothetical protein [Caulobacter hibisci]|uniref:Uncharacterized protein n=1 Tax=Caulobacter hibisci TaxID=2035993 RepID=A0ABS0SX52_9CAUL|nr:hypothetical protein [Caulobacter hibisci]MBI1684184.1 hypothetical protein [Caulobacter hibisci]